MDTRRTFIKKAAMLGGGVGLWSALPASIKRALEIDPEKGSTFMDAEHVVLLMQENRSFDHLLGSLQGVRGYNDPRAITIPNGNKVWLQTDEKGQTYAPFRLDIKKTRSTWTGNLPHSWTNQTDARNQGGFDRWLEAKKSGYEKYAHLPLTLGHYTREDIPFYYALADAFTVCDQHFCSSLTGTTPNRLFFFTGKLRGGKNNQANVDNSNVDYQNEVDWQTFPERLEQAGISWKVYQNDISLDNGMTGTEDFWLGNFTDNPLEWFKQHGVRYSPGHYDKVKKDLAALPERIGKAREELKVLTGKEQKKAEEKIQEMEAALAYAKEAVVKYSPEAFKQLPARLRALHNKAFTVNSDDPYYHQVDTIHYQDADSGRQKQMKAPKGDVFYQFRKDVESGKLPKVSWLVAPQAFSDHPSAPWYGAWYVSETMDILTSNPEVWKKTIFILTYDENDGYYDHVPPFVAPNPRDPASGLASEGLDIEDEYVSLEEDLLRVGNRYKAFARQSPVGLGYRVPLLIASPWSRGGWVNSQVCDHTSVLQLLESWLSKKLGKAIKEENIGSWRRAICGNLHSVFRPFNGRKVDLPFIDRNDFLGSIQQAKDKELPDGFHLMTPEEITLFNAKPSASPYQPKQEKGIRNACALPYELYADLNFDFEKKRLGLCLQVADKLFGEKAVGAPFTAYGLGGPEAFRVRNYSLKPAGRLEDSWQLDLWQGASFCLQLHGPNGFFRSWQGKKKSGIPAIRISYQKGKDLAIEMKNTVGRSLTISIKDNSYGAAARDIRLEAGALMTIAWPAEKSYGWYDFSIVHPDFECQYAGRIEDGEPGKTDPLMGGIL
ncbi:phosphocholine-specific phospholipase C [Arachidicoccus terrestris]|uniref:phosphocholine-specific phospholipase C n=1 Tax=Arachidicoccus terrestris TaxID=2875539 RepID=UPI001CC5A184|nr:phospholipase C, phosphocholine-specific [Arachidicoccus terrestris]UAY55647.1 phospholipase C, phosphocholine-specific [Arachidicoccus terrestris]